MAAVEVVVPTAEIRPSKEMDDLRSLVWISAFSFSFYGCRVKLWQWRSPLWRSSAFESSVSFSLSIHRREEMVVGEAAEGEEVAAVRVVHALPSECSRMYVQV